MKYELTKETINHCGRTLYRIKAIKDFGSIKKGDLGGYIEFTNNLCQYGDAWVSGNAWVFSNALVYGNAKVAGKELLKDNSYSRTKAELSYHQLTKQENFILKINEDQQLEYTRSELEQLYKKIGEML